MRQNKVCMLTTVHIPFDTRIFWKEAKSLKRAGYEVILVARHKKSETIDGIRIVRLLEPSNRFTRMFILTWKAFVLSLKQKADIYHFHDPELLFHGILLKFLTRSKVIYDVHEDVSKEILGKEWLPVFLRKWVSMGVSLIERLAAFFFDAVIAATPAIAKNFPNNKVTTVQNYPKLDDLKISFDVEYKNRPNWITYVGDIREVRGAHEMVQAMELLSDIKNIKLCLAGRFNPPSLEEELKCHPGWKYVEFMGWKTKEQVFELFKSCRAGLVLLHPLPNHLSAEPNKFYEYMAAGLPVVASNFPLWQEIIEKNRCGLLVNPLDTSDIAKAIRYILEHPNEAGEMGTRGREVIKEKYHWEHEEAKLLSLYSKNLKV